MLFSSGKTILLLVVLLVICGSIILAQKKSVALATPHGYAKSALLPLFAIRAAARDLAARQWEDERQAAAVQQENQGYASAQAKATARDQPSQPPAR